MGAEEDLRRPEPEGSSSGPTGEAETGKVCALCGVAGTVLAWRPCERASSPLTEPKWWPTRPVYEARLTCPRCGCASYGWLVAAEPLDLTGEFLIASPAELRPW